MENAWLLVSAILVFIMQAGFLCLESGRTRSKNSINVAAKNLADFILSSSIFWMFGYALMFGISYEGFLGTSDFFFGDDKDANEMSYFIFQMMFCGTAATLTSGAVAERMTFSGYLFITLILCAFIYPVTGHWAWAGLYNKEATGWLESMGFVDFAGSTVVHSVGGWVALAAIVIVGPRLGRFNPDSKFPIGHNLPFAALGTLLIWFGWFGFNGGSTLALTDKVPAILLNTCLSAIWGGIGATVIHFARHKFIDVNNIMNGIIAGLVGITASCFAVTASEAAFIGVVSGVIVYFGTLMMDRLGLDDAIGVVPAHLFTGIWGTLCVALFGDPLLLNTGLSFNQQLQVQLLGVVIIGFYAFSISYVCMYLFNLAFPLRVSHRNEMRGLNITEHQATTELIDLLNAMEVQQVQGDFTEPVPTEPFTEVGQIAAKYNQVISRVSEEILQRDTAIDQFKASEKRKGAILDSSMDCIVSIDRHGAIIEFNPAAERTFGILKRQVEGRNFIESFVDDDLQDQVKESLKHQFSSSHGLIINKRNTLTLKHSSSHTFPAEIAITSTRLGLNVFEEYTLHIRDITRQVKLQNRLRFLAYRDPLTSLYNRTYLIERLEIALKDAADLKQTVALLFLDLDKFKRINDTLGHKAGDELLCEVASRLNSVSRASDTIARWGGDEFIVLLVGELDKEVVCERAHSILQAMRAPVVISEHEYTIPTSIGIALSPLGTVGSDKLVQQADIAMYYAKQSGRDNYQLFTQDMAKTVNQNINSEREIKDALNAGQFSLVYQPKVYQDQSNIVGLESLIRWYHPTKGLISPAEFIPLAEETNLIIQIDEEVIEQTLNQLSLWRQQGADLVPVSVNISGKHLISNRLVAFISERLAHYGIEGKYLEIEITEGVLLQDIERCIGVMAELKAIGIRISVDDFGTGYSSLSYLKRLPLDILKIDRSFVSECDITEEDAQICSTIIHLAKSLGLLTVAEGVETEGQRNMLLDQGCNVFQGFYFYKPLPQDDILLLLKHNQLIDTLDA